MANVDLYLKEGQTGILFDKSTMDVAFVALGRKTPVDAAKGAGSPLGVPAAAGLLSTVRPEAPDRHEHFPDSNDSRPQLERLTLTVNNTCNLGCSYCYAAGGTYYNTKGLFMTKTTALRAIDAAVKTYSRIQHISIFGGEPTLSRDIIPFICGYVDFLRRKKEILYKPTFGITTNGYKVDDDLVDLLKTHDFSVTLSLDGPEDIHDRKRPTKRGGATHARICANADKLLEAGLNLEFECTFTRDHLNAGYTIVHLIDYFHDRFGCRVLHCPIVSAKRNSAEHIPYELAAQLEGDAVEYSIENLAKGVPKCSSTTVRLLNSLIHKNPINRYCPAGTDEITVNADGRLYACFMLMQRPEFSLAQVNGDAAGGAQPTSPSQAERIGEFISRADKWRNPECAKCWAQPLCHGCMGEDFEREGFGVTRSATPGVSAFCDKKRSVIERFFRALAKASAKPPSDGPQTMAAT